jgi:hypothetical protein
MKNCNRIEKEGNCDGSKWIECTYCGAVNNEKCLNKPRYVEKYDEIAARILSDALGKIRDRSLAPYEMQAVLIYLLDGLYKSQSGMGFNVEVIYPAEKR